MATAFLRYLPDGGGGEISVLAWNGSEFVRVTSFWEWGNRFSDEVRQTVREAKEKREAREAEEKEEVKQP